MPGKRLLVLLLILCVFGGLYLWRHFFYSGEKFLTGNPIDLLDEFKDEFILKSRITKPLRVIHKEKLGKIWQKLNDIGSISVWRTFAQNPIAGPVAPRLYKDRSQIQRETQIFDENVQPNRWNYSDNQIFVTVTAGEDPIHSNYFLDYETDPDAKLVQISDERLENGLVFPGKFTLYPLQHPVSPKIIVRRDGEPMSDSQWIALPEFRTLLYRSSVLGVFKMFGKSEVYRKDLYLPDGLADFIITAKADLAGDENPEVGLYLDHKKLAEIEIARREQSVYSAVSPVTEGMHRFELVFENDFYDPDTRADRNVDLMEVALIYKPAMLIKEPAEGRSHKHSIDYRSSDSASANFYWDFFHERKLNNEWIHSVATGVALQEELRRSLVLTPGDQFSFPIRLGNSPHLQFGFGFKPSTTTTAGRILIKIHRPFHLSKTLLSLDLHKKDSWNEIKMDISEFAGENIRLAFEAIPSNSPFIAFISNPAIASAPQAQSVNLLFLLSFDALRADHLGVYGYDRPTSPNIDGFAKDAVLFENASTAATWTLPSFGSLFTSLYPSFHDARDISKPLHHSLPSFPELIDRQGFATAAFIQNPLLHPLYGFAKGFDFYNYHISKNVEERARTALDWLAVSQGHRKFLFVHLISPHTPYTAPEAYLKKIGVTSEIDPSAYGRFMNRKQCEKPAQKDLEDVLLMYDAEIRQADDLFQNYIQKIRELGWYDRAMIILMSDHGEEFLDHGAAFHGQNVFPATSHVPLIIKFPAEMKFRGLRIPDRVSLIDVMPTILETLGINGPSEMQGQNLLRIIRGWSQNTERMMITENRKGIVGITRNNYHYVYTDPAARGWSCPPRKLEELYDLKNDPAEIHDLSTQLPDVLSLFRAERENYFSHAQKFRKTKLGSSRKVEPEQELKEQMKALGYVQ